MWRSHGSRGGLGSADRVCQAGGSRTRAAGGALSRTSQQGAGALVEAGQQGANSALHSSQHAAVARARTSWSLPHGDPLAAAVLQRGAL